MRNVSAQNLQIKLSLDEGLNNIWKFLTKEYEGLDKAGIIRLALNNLAKVTERNVKETIKFDMGKFLDELDQKQDGPSEEDFAVWWNKNKHDLRQ